MTADLAQSFLLLFAGHTKAHGQWDPDKPRREAARTVSEAPGEEQVEAHLKGTLGLGVVPIRDDDTCSWGVLDIDAHDEAQHIDLEELEALVIAAKLPVVICRSKSGGAHLFLFLKRPLAAKLVQTVLKDWARKLKIPLRNKDKSKGDIAPIEVFPKQIRQNGIGNWLNLPYFGTRSAKGTDRYAVQLGKKLSFSDFLDLAERMKQDREDILIAGDLDLDGAPPCLERIWKEGAPVGTRDNTLVAFGTFFKKQGIPDLYMALMKVNKQPGVMSPRSLVDADVKKVANSLKKRDYRYRCNESPVCDLCDSATCKTRKFGITETPTQEYGSGRFGSLQKLLTIPPRWGLAVNDKVVDLTTEELMSYRMIRMRTVELLSVMLPPKKEEDWLVEVGDMMASCTEIEAPDDATVSAMVLSMLAEFTATAEDKAHSSHRQDILRGIPALTQSATGADVVAFRSQDFLAYLRRKKVGVEKAQEVWNIVRKMGCTHERLYIQGVRTLVWMKPVSPIPEGLEIPELVPEF